MKIINRYLSANVLLGLSLAIAIATFVMLAGQFARIFDLLSRGVPFTTLFGYVAYRVPQALGFTIPIGLFISTVLLFHRMSSDHEITALRASGISIMQITAPLILLSLCLSILCLMIQGTVAPECLFRAKTLVREAKVQNPMMLLEDGRFVEIFDGYIIYVGKKSDSELSDIHLYVLNQDDKVVQKVNAETGEVRVNEEMKQLELTLNSATIESSNPEDPGDVSKIRRVRGETCTFVLEYGEWMQARPLVREVGEMRLSQLFARIQIYGERGIDTGPLYVELHIRAALGLSPFSFILIGIPLGIRPPRREATYRLFACVLIPLLYFVLMSFLESLRYATDYSPELLAWLPNITCQIAGIVTLWAKR